MQHALTWPALRNDATYFRLKRKNSSYSTSASNALTSIFGPTWNDNTLFSRLDRRSGRLCHPRLIWLGYIARDFYANAMGDLRADSFRISPAIAFYIVMVTGTVIFAVRPALGAESWTTATMLGAAFGFFCYATYDLHKLSNDTRLANLLGDR